MNLSAASPSSRSPDSKSNAILLFKSVSFAARKAVVLLGDPQQLDQPTQGNHPDGVDTSALDHMLAGHQTIPEDRGLFLEETWRLHPTICAFTSELFYEGRLHPRQGLELQEVRSTSELHGSGLRYLPVAHTGNQSSSPEEAEVACALVNDLLASNPTWINREGVELRLPKREAARLALKIRDAKARADVEDNYRKTVGQALGGIVVLLGTGLAYLQFSQQQRASDLQFTQQQRASLTIS